MKETDHEKLFKDLYDSDATETLVIEGIVWKDADALNLPEEVRVRVNTKTLAKLENGEENPDLAEETLMDIRDFVEHCWGHLIQDIDGWYAEG